MDMLFEWLVDTVCHWIGFRVLKMVTFGRFVGKSTYWDGLVPLVGLLVLLSPFIAFITWLIINSGG